MQIPFFALARIAYLLFDKTIVLVFFEKSNKN
jgi:hypothetical protein